MIYIYRTYSMNGLVFDNTDTKTISMLIDIIKKDKEIIAKQLIENKKDKEIIEEQLLEINELKKIKEDNEKRKTWAKNAKKRHYEKNKDLYIKRALDHKKNNPELVKQYRHNTYLNAKKKKDDF